MNQENKIEEPKKESKISCFVNASSCLDGSAIAKCPHCGMTCSTNKAEAGIKTEFNCEHYFVYQPKTNRVVFLKQVYK